jgi:hypothetical protein
MPTKNDRNNDRLFISRMVGVTFKNRGSKLYPTKNISLSGMYIVGQFSHPVGSPCTVTLHEVWAGRQFVLNLSGKVTRVDKEGLAICHTEMGLKTFSLLQTLLLYESRNPTAMGEEFTKDCSFAIRESRVSGNRQRFAGRFF